MALIRTEVEGLAARDDLVAADAGVQAVPSAGRNRVRHRSNIHPVAAHQVFGEEDDIPGIPGLDRLVLLRRGSGVEGNLFGAPVA